MKRLILIFTLLSSMSSAFTQEKVWLDKNDQWIADSTKAIRYALVAQTSPNSIKVEEYTLEGQKKDIWHFSDYNSNPRRRIREGIHIAFHANGKDSLTEVYSNNKLEGEAITYYPNSSIHFVMNYKNGRLNGKLLQYYPDGKLHREEDYSNNECTNGKLFDESGTEIEHQPYFRFPSFPGGIQKIRELITHIIIYPEKARKKKVEGRVLLQFTVDTEGKMVNPQILQSVRHDIDSEAIRAFNSIAKAHRWLPGYQGGKAKNVRFVVPIYFTTPK